MLILLQQIFVLWFSFGYGHHYILHDVDDKGQKYTEKAICSSNLSWKNVVKVLVPSYTFFRQNGSASFARMICIYTQLVVSHISHDNWQLSDFVHTNKNTTGQYIKSQSRSVALNASQTMNSHNELTLGTCTQLQLILPCPSLKGMC